MTEPETTIIAHVIGAALASIPAELRREFADRLARVYNAGEPTAVAAMAAISRARAEMVGMTREGR